MVIVYSPAVWQASYNKHKHFKIIHKIKLFLTSFSTINTVCPVKEIIFCNSCLSLYKTCNICLVILFATYFGTFFLTYGWMSQSDNCTAFLFPTFIFIADSQIVNNWEGFVSRVADRSIVSQTLFMVITTDIPSCSSRWTNLYYLFVLES